MTVSPWSSEAVAGKPPKRTPEPGYECNIEMRGDFGVILADFQVPDSGKARSDYIRWDAGGGQFRNPWVTAAFYRRENGGYSLGNGYVHITRHIWDRSAGRKRTTVRARLELTSDPTAAFPSSRMSGELRRSGGPFHLQLHWPDAAALAKGASTLHLVARAPRHEVIDQVEIDRTIFSRAEPHILAAFAEAHRMLASPREHCVRSDDLGTDDVIVT